MTKVQNPITGRSKGQAGGMVFTTLFGSNIIKAKPYSYRDANTQVQRDNRSLHVALVRAAASQKTIARSLFLQQPATMSAYSRIVQQLQSTVDRSGSSPVIDPNDIEIGSGNLEMPITETTYTALSGIAEGVLDLSGDPNLPTGATSSHVFLAFDQNSNTIKKATATLTHATGEFTATFEEPVPASNSAFALAYSNSRSGADLVKNVKRWYSVA